MNPSYRILICDDHIAVHETLTLYLKAQNMVCVSAFDGDEALRRFQTEPFDLIILDVMMPRRLGTDLCSEIRKSSSIPILLLSARSEEDDRIFGLELGADDYVTKPFSPREVAVRVKNMLKRTHSPEILRIGAFEWDTAAYEVRKNAQRIDLTPKEFEAFLYLAQNQCQVISRDQLAETLWGFDYDKDLRSVDSLIKRIRQKIPKGPAGVVIRSIYGVGYKLEGTP